MQLPCFLFDFLLLWQTGRDNGAAATGLTIVAILIFSFVGIIFLLSVGLVAFLRKQKQKRIRNLQMFAAQNGWQSISNADVNFFQNSNYYRLFAAGRNKNIAGLMHRQYGGGQVFLFDYEYTTGSGKSTKVHTQTVVAYHSPHLNLPYFSLYPESFLSFIGEAFGYNDIDFASHPHFSKRYKLSGGDERAVRQTFHPQMLSYFDQLPTVNIDGGGNFIFVYESNKTAPSENLNWFIGERIKYLNLFGS